ncbi:MADS-box transcription factor 56-like [Juglans microcarpa x Juglans regia]|uniref:MADS-box transcription factor 56-like n=1 Tax=Juglans microcarpa x Juglans regia TaxID=2249226 RepID=UPI001B7DDCC6|nr:MADS-box transcription factor 56-like [Juglans microcarpa x Juglans regia]
MGRRRRSMEFISNDKSRMITYHKRKKGLEKKLYEISTLCGIKACMIIYGPRSQNGHPCDMATWPENDEDCVRTLVNKFKSNTISSARKRGTRDLSDYFIDRKKNIEKEISRKRTENCRSNIMFRTWDERMDYFSCEQLRIVQGFLDTKIEAVQRKIDMLKAADNKSFAMNIDAALEITGNSNDVFGSIPSDFPNYTQGMLQRINVGLDLQAGNLLPMPKSYVKSLDDLNGLQWPDFYSSYNQGDHSSLLPFCVNPLADPMKVKVDEACSSHGNMSISTGIQYSPPNYPIYYDLAVGLMENMTVINNSMLPPMFNYNPRMQMIPPINVRNPMMQTLPDDDQMHGPPADMNSLYTYIGTHGINEFEIDEDAAA